MGTKDSRVNAYIQNANPFARPILKRLRKWAHRHCPECVETLKGKRCSWRSPFTFHPSPFTLHPLPLLPFTPPSAPFPPTTPD